MTIPLGDESSSTRASTAAVLDHAWDTGVFRTDDIMAAAGLTRSTAISAIDRLIELGLIRELANARSERGYRTGRPARRFELRADAGIIVGLDAGRTRFTTIAADLSGAVLVQRHDEVGILHDSPDERRAAATRAIEGVIADAGAGPEDVLALAVGVPAPVDTSGRSPAHEERFWERMNPGFRDFFADRFPVVRVENDAALAAVAEGSVGAARGIPSFVALLAGSRMGAGVVLEGRLVRGTHGGIGELDAFIHVSGVGSAHGIGQRADEWVRAARADGRVPAAHPLARIPDADLTAQAEFAHIRADDPVTSPLVEELGALLARICGVLGSFYDPERIVVCGAVADALDDVIASASRRVGRALDLPAPTIMASRLGGDVVALGAIAAAREEARSIAIPLLARRLSAAAVDEHA
ncbi:MAG: ROK family protein [Microbacterium sp.]|uniref:ROK family protein n=1 Tax=Microbacterium sp. TaxID=51671 RepID=UPI0039E4BE0D